MQIDGVAKLLFDLQKRFECNQIAFAFHIHVAADGDGAGVEGDGASSGSGLGVGPDGLVVIGVVDVDEGADDGDACGVEVDVCPRQSECLSSTEAGGGEQVPQGVLPGAAGGVEERGELGGGPGLRRAGAVGRGGHTGWFREVVYFRGAGY